MSIDRIGSIKDYTPNFKMIIPRFDLATWHDYIEENFRNIDALFFNLFGINNYSGPWKQITSYKADQVLFIPDDRDINGEETIYSGRLVKVLVDHVTDNSDYFNVFYNLHPEYYELFADAGAAQIFAQQAQDASKEAKNSENIIIQKQIEINDTISEFNDNVVTKTEELSQQIAEGIEVIEQNTQIAVDNAEKSRIFAIGEQEEVEILAPDMLSSRGFANLSMAIANAPVDVPIDESNIIALDVIKGPKGDKGDPGEDGKDGGGLEIGDIAPSVFGIDETKNLRRYLNGQVISQTQFETFTNIVKERAKLYPNIVTTEENWQAEVTNSKLGQCGKFVIDDELGTIRLPKVINIQGLQDLTLMGNIKAESLPNITGTVINNGGDIALFNQSATTGLGAFTVKYKDGIGAGNYSQITGNFNISADFDASRVSSTYQDNAPVQQEAIQYPYFIQVATGVEESVDVTREIALNNPFSLLDYKWSEYEITNASWLLSNGAFHSGTVYKSVYELLLKIYNGTEIKDGVSVKLSTETYTDTDFVINTADTTFRLPIKVALVGGGSSVVKSYQPTDGYVNKENLANVAIYHKDSGQIAGSAGLAVGGGYLQNMNATTYGSQALDFAFYSDLSQATNDKLKLYFYVGETIQDANVIAASQVLTDIADLKSYVAGMPDFSAGIVCETSLNAEKTYTAPKDGIIIYGLSCYGDGKICYIKINGVQVMRKTAYSTSGVTGLNGSLSVNKGDVITYFSPYGNTTYDPQNIIFYPYKGAK